MVINVHAGHAAVGKGSTGAVGLISESVEDRKVKDVVITYLRASGHTVYDCTVDEGTQSQILSGIVKKCNERDADLDVSIHFNAGAGRQYNDGITTGAEVLIYSDQSASKDEAVRILNRIAALGFTNRGVKTRTDLYVLKKTKAPALLVECCFVDDKDDTDKYNADAMGKAIAEGILDADLTVANTPAANAPVVGSKVNKKVKIKAKRAANRRIRTGPGSSYKIKGHVPTGVVYTIVEINGNWGKLKSGAGWINIKKKYVTYI